MLNIFSKLRFSRRVWFFVALAFVVVFLGLFFFFFRDKAVLGSDPEIVRREVEVASIYDLSLDQGTFALSGKVQSLSELTLRAETGGAIKRLNYRLGDSVSAGDIIIELDNGAQQADLARARSVLAGVNLQLGGGEASLKEAEIGLINNIKSAYVLADDAVRNRADKLFTNPRSYGPKFQVSFQNGNTYYYFGSSNYELQYQTELARRKIELALEDWQEKIPTLNASTDLKEETSEAVEILEQIRTMLDNLALMVNNFSTTELAYKQTVDGYKSDLALARQSINGAISTLLAGQDVYLNKNTGSAVTESSLDQARAGVRLAEINLAKTLLRSPITGTINRLTVKLGDFVSPSQEIAFISNNQALEIIAYITENDLAGLKVGNRVKVENLYDGIITSLAPALDPVTKKMEIKIGLRSERVNLVNGQTVKLALSRQEIKPGQVLTKMLIPLSALKIEPERLVVFSLEPASEAKYRLKAHEVKEGPIVGDKIIITEVDPDLEIVLDARGLKAGDLVWLKS